MKISNLNKFQGRNAIKDFLNPDKNPIIPLVELPEHCNPFAKDGIRIFAKLMNMLPLANVKSLPALNMLLEAEKAKKLKGVHTLIENSSGNTVFSLATIARLFGIENTKAIVSHEVTWGKLQLLRIFGTEIIVNEEPICPDPNDKESGIYKAKRKGKEKGWFNPGQYDNEANPRSHYKWTAPQIWKQTEGKISIFCSGVGTTGTILGVGSYLKEKSKKITIVGVARSPNNPVPGVRTPNLLREIAFEWRKVTDYVEEIGTKESFEESLKLCRAGLMVGPSSGFALAGLFSFLSKQKSADKLARLKNRNGEIIAVFVCPDSPLPYLNEYFEYLDESSFPMIENEQLLINRPERSKKSKALLQNFTGIDPVRSSLAEVLWTRPEGASETSNGVEITAEDAYKTLYAYPKKKLWGLVNKKKEVFVSNGIKLLDVRTSEEYQHAHLPCSENIDHAEVLEKISVFSNQWRGKKVVVICRSGRRSALVAETLQKNGIEAVNVQGGMIEWSRLNLPRWRPEICKI